MPEVEVLEQQDTAATPETEQPTDVVEDVTTDQSEEVEPTDPDAETEPTPEAPTPKNLADLSDEELEADERIANLRKSWESRAAESARQSAEAETKKRATQQAREFQRTGQARTSLNGEIARVVNQIKAKIENGDTVDSAEMAADPRMLNWVTQQMHAGAMASISDQWIEATENYWPEDLTMPKELIELGVKVKDGQYDAVPHHISKFLDEYRRAAVEAEIPKLKKQWEKERKASAKAEAEVQRAADAAAGRDPGPTGGGEGASSRTAREIFDDPNVSFEERTKAYEKLYGRKFEVIQ